MASEAQVRTAAEVYVRTGNLSEAARQAEVHRSTLLRWLATPEFQGAIAAAKESAEDVDVSGQATKSLSDLVTDSVSVIERVLQGDKTLVSSARVALDVIKTAAQLAPKGASSDGTPPLADLLTELDQREKKR